MSILPFYFFNNKTNLFVANSFFRHQLGALGFVGVQANLSLHLLASSATHTALRPLKVLQDGADGVGAGDGLHGVALATVVANLAVDADPGVGPDSAAASGRASGPSSPQAPVCAVLLIIL